MCVIEAERLHHKRRSGGDLIHGRSWEVSRAIRLAHSTIIVVARSEDLLEDETMLLRITSNECALSVKCERDLSLSISAWSVFDRAMCMLSLLFQILEVLFKV